MKADDGGAHTIIGLDGQYSAQLGHAEFIDLVERARVFAASGEGAACQILGRWLAVELSDTRRTAILESLAESPCRSVPIDLLIKLLRTPQLDLALASARLLVLMGAEGEEVMLKTLKDIRAIFTRVRCLTALLYGRSKLNENSMKSVVNFASGRNRDLRLVGLTVLALRGDTSCTGFLVDCLARPDLLTREAALKALVAVGDSSAVDAVLAQLEKDAPRRSNPHSPVIDLELTYLAQYAELRPEVFTAACDVTARTWKRRDDAELKWIRSYMRVSSPEDFRGAGNPLERDVQRMRSRVVDELRKKNTPRGLIF